ncbi:MAG: ATP synthase subunit I [Sporolactobacillus sp.]|uniref:ATP synthase subunit I n=1 Tax=Sporolactobacillus sp. STSJ-5 TaxID=2965076 RepID=UPI002103C002|nr:ATP synthase subunit I [Sporolactobacillus sp. STSJ-5]MCQ2010787.1 ATP synthase subunit I [Sporolactobacillus sp. STSJ-5]
MKPVMEWFSRVLMIVAIIYTSVFGLIWFLIPARALASGFLLGGLISLYNVFHLSFRLRIAGLRVQSGARHLAGLHMTVRIATIVFGVLMVYRFPTRIDYRSFVLSLLFGYLMLVTVMSYYYLKGNGTTSSDEGGETHGSDSESEISRNDI